jgi:hypothetical protein
MRALGLLTVGACLVGGLAFAPVFFTYGLAFLHAPGGWAWPTRDALERMTLAVWGFPGLAAIIVTVAVRLIRRPSAGECSLPSLSLGVTLASSVAVLLYLIAFLRLPDQAAYLLPIIPFVLVLLARFLLRPYFVIVCAMLAISPLVGTNLGEQRAEIKGQLRSLAYFKTWSSTLPSGTVVALGEWQPLVEAQFPFDFGGHRQVELLYQLDSDQVQAYRALGRQVYFVPGRTGGGAGGGDLTLSGALPIPSPRPDET